MLILTVAERADGVLSEARLKEVVRTFRDTGLVVIGNAFDPAFLLDVRAAYEVELARYVAARGGLAALDGKTFGKNHVGFFPSVTLPMADGQIVAHPIATQLLVHFLGADLQSSFFHTNTAYPESGTQPVHRDAQPLFRTEMGVPHPPASIVLNVPLCDFTVANGSTEYWPGTHLIVDSTPDEGKSLEARAATLPSIRLDMPLGSFALRDLRAWHRGMPNIADYTRTMYAIVYQREFLTYVPTTIPRTTWESWSETARHIFRRNRVVEDSKHQSLTWEDLLAK